MTHIELLARVLQVQVALIWSDCVSFTF